MKIEFKRSSRSGFMGQLYFSIQVELNLDENEESILRKTGLWEKPLFFALLGENKRLNEEGISIAHICAGVVFEFKEVVSPEELREKMIEFVSNQVASLLKIVPLYEDKACEEVLIQIDK